MTNKILPVFCLLFSVFCDAALIKSPVPPASTGHFVADKNKDAKADFVAVQFLQPVSAEYLANVVDSVVVCSKDSIAEKSVTVRGADLKLDSSGKLAGANVAGFDVGVTNVAGKSGFAMELYQKGMQPVVLAVADSMAPQVLQISAVSGNGANADTLEVLFSEPVAMQEGLVQVRSAADNAAKEFSFRPVKLDFNARQLLLLEANALEAVAPSDTVVLVAGLAADSAKNKSIEARMPLSCIPAFRVVTVPTAEFKQQNIAEAPIFELKFERAGEAFPAGHLGMAMDLGTKAFNKAVSDLLAGKKKTLEPGKLLVRFDMTVYSHNGEFLTSSHAEIRGDDSGIASGARSFFFWNFMDGRRRLVGSGVYIIRTDVQILYEGSLLYRNDVGALRSYGVLRR